MIYVSYESYKSEEGFGGNSLTEEQFIAQRKKAQGFVDLITFDRIHKMAPEDIPDNVKDAVCSLTEWLKTFDDGGGGALKASETIKSQSVTYVRDAGASKDSEMYKIAMGYLEHSPLTYRGF